MPRSKRRPARQQVVLIGYRGCGKSGVGRLVAAELGWEFIDTDELVEQAAGRSIAAIFASDGEAAFREMECGAIARAVQGTRRVLSVGGGAVLAAENRDRLRAAGTCVWLTAPAEELQRRLQADPRSAQRRPPLTAATRLDEVRSLLAAREPLYEAVADHVIDTSGRTAEAVAQEVVALVSAAGGAKKRS